MTALSTALNFAKSSLSIVGSQSAVASRNISNATNPDYNKKSAAITSLSSGSLAIAGYERSADKLLLEKLLNAIAQEATSGAVLNGTKSLATIIGDPQDASSPAGMLGKFQTALQTYEHNPSDEGVARNLLLVASQFVKTINTTGDTIQNIRKQADTDMSQSVDQLNKLLQKFKTVNDYIVKSDTTSPEYVENLDTRDQLIKQISTEVGIKIVVRERNDIALYTDSGITLFETEPRTVTMQPTSGMTAAVSGNPVYIDGVDITTQGGPMLSHSGAICGYAKLRDDIAVTAQAQIDELARSLIEAFAETDQSATPTQSPAAGLFTYTGGPAIPTTATTVPGIASLLKINPAADPQQGGLVTRLRDGGMNGAAYVYNTSGGASYAKRLTGLVDSLNQARGFSPDAKVETQASILKFSTTTAGWIADLNKKAASASELQDTIKSRANDALQNDTGVSIDDEMANMLELERSYQASAKLISIVDDMIKNILSIAG